MPYSVDYAETSPCTIFDIGMAFNVALAAFVVLYRRMSSRRSIACCDRQDHLRVFHLACGRIDLEPGADIG